MCSIAVAKMEIPASEKTILKDDWQFCPTEAFFANIDINQLTCYPINLPSGWESVF
jgi:hypothetical protein